MKPHPMLTLFRMEESNAQVSAMLWGRKPLRDGICPECGGSMLDYAFENAQMTVGGGNCSRWPNILANLLTSA